MFSAARFNRAAVPAWMRTETRRTPKESIGAGSTEGGSRVSSNDWIKRYRAAITRNVSTLAVEMRTLQADLAALQEIIRVVRPDVERDYEWGYQWGVVPEGPEFDALIEQATADIRACRAPGEPETHPERYLSRVPIKLQPKEDFDDEPKHFSTEEEYERAQLRKMQRLNERRKQRLKNP